MKTQEACVVIAGMVLIGLVCYWTKSAWPLLALIPLFRLVLI